MTADTPSRWYSISKPITALALAQLVAQGKLRWEQPVSQLVPGLQFADPVATTQANVRDCLLHRTGLPTGNWTWWQAPADPAELLRRLPHIPCSAGFRGGHEYQNLGFTILGEVFQACGTTWHQAIHELLEPLGIKPLTRLAEFVAADRMLGYGPNGFAPAAPAGDFDFEAIAPASAVCGTIRELAKLGNALAYDGRGLLPSAAWAEVIRPELAMPSPDWPEMRQPGVALAGRTLNYRGELVLHWAGGWVGYVSHLLAVPSRRVAVCALANRTSSNVSDLLAFAMLDRAAGWNPAPWADRYLEQKRGFRRAAEERLAARFARPRGNWPCAPSTMTGRFTHPGYGDLEVQLAGDGLQLQFRECMLLMTPRTDGTVSAEGGTGESRDTAWDLRPVVNGRELVAWEFGPDDPAAPCRFERVI
jgi:CubicO group peptidase (beta-lactamase class C family)